jgi:hypothetical protein
MLKFEEEPVKFKGGNEEEAFKRGYGVGKTS